MNQSRQGTIAKKNEKKTVSNLPPKRIAIYVIYDKDGLLDGFRKYYLQELRRVTDQIVVVVSGQLTAESRDELETLADEVFVRENKGLLGGAWVDGIKHIGWKKLYQYDELLMLNDSFFGPFYPLKDMFDAMEKSDADFYGAMQNFEEKEYHEIAGRPLKHGYFRGSIGYFYVIKRKLLHSGEFKAYWDREVDIKEDWDTLFFAEINFYDYVVDCGFRVDAYQSDRLKGYLFDNLSHNMEKLVHYDKIPFARIRPFSTDEKKHALMVHYAKDTRNLLTYIDQHTDYDVNYIWDYLLRTKNMATVYQQLQLNYIVSRNKLDAPFTCKKKTAVLLHIEHEDMVVRMSEYCTNFPTGTKFFITATEESAAAAIRKKFDKLKLDYQCKIRKSIGAAMPTLWITFADVIASGEYDYFCFFNDMKNEKDHYSILWEQFGLRCYENLLGTKEVVENILQLFEKNPRLGVLGAPAPYHGTYFGLYQRYYLTDCAVLQEFAKEKKIKANINPDITGVAPHGNMFWFRAEALKSIKEFDLSYEDFLPDQSEAYQERFIRILEWSYSLIAQDAGYYYADCRNDDEARSDLSNYEYMMSHCYEILLKNGQWPMSLDVTRDVLEKTFQYTAVADEEQHKMAQTYNDLEKMRQQIEDERKNARFLNLIKRVLRRKRK